MITSSDVGIYHETQKGSPKVVYEVEKEEKNTGKKIKVSHSDNGG